MWRNCAGCCGRCCRNWTFTRPPWATCRHATPDPLALRDDLAFAAQALADNPGPDRQRYVTAFLQGIAAHAHDSLLANAAQLAGDGPGLDRLRALLAARLLPASPIAGPG